MMTTVPGHRLREEIRHWWVAKVRQPHRRFARTCYAQEGEDMILRRALRKRKHGFYVDVGAHHPFRFSNTFMLYKKGWQGINIDATPGSMQLFARHRPRDINLEAAVADSVGTVTFYVFADPALNTCDELQAKESVQRGVKLIDKQRLETRRLEQVLDQYLPRATAIDMMSVDVEGLDLQVLKSNNWAKYRPAILLVERLGLSFPALLQNELYLYLTSQGYDLYAKTVNTVFFRDARSNAAPF
jgi:FkbM family methyltransferase